MAGQETIFGSPESELTLPKYRVPRYESKSEVILELIRDELFLDGNARQNLATFCQTYADDEVRQLMDLCIDKNIIDKDEYPQSTEIESRCIHMLANLWNAPESCHPVGTSTVGSSEACMLGGLAMYFRWKQARKQVGKPTDRPNLVSGPVQVCWEKFARYWDIELRQVPMEPGRLAITPEAMLPYLDENTIGVVTTLGLTFTGAYEPVDLLLVAVKATVLEQAIQDIAKFVGPDTVILSVLNGITSEEHIDAAYPGHTLWSVAIGMDATRTGRTLVFNQAGRIQFGERSGEMTDRVQAVADYLDECGIANEPCGDILYKQWNKLMVNDGLNQAAAAFDQPYGGLRQPGEAQDMMRAAMQEVIRLANLEGVPLPPDNDVRFIDAMMPTFNPDGMPSMRQDVLAKRPTEVEEFAGVVRQRAKKYGMPTPANDFFYTRIREIEAGYDQ